MKIRIFLKNFMSEFGIFWPQLKRWCCVDFRSWIESHAEQWWSSVQALQAWASDELCRRLVRRLSSPHVLRRGSGVRAVVEVSRRTLTRFLLLVHTPIFLDNRTNYNSPGFEGFLTFWTFVIILQVSMQSSQKMTSYCWFWNALLFLSRLSSPCRFTWPSSVPSWSKSTWFTKTWRCGTTPAIKGSSAEHSIFQRS